MMRAVTICTALLMFWSATAFGQVANPATAPAVAPTPEFTAPGGPAGPAAACGCDPNAPNGYAAPICFGEPTWCADPFPLYRSPLATAYVQTEALALRRFAHYDQDFATLNTPTNVVLSTNNLDFQNQGGLRVLLGRRLNDWYAIEASYFGLMDWSESAEVRDATANAQGTTGNLFSPFSNFGDPAAVVGQDFNNFAQIRSDSSLDNGELNLRQRMSTPPTLMQGSMLYGVRYMNVQERFQYLTQSTAPVGPGTQNSVDVNTKNTMLGFQIGMALEFRVEPSCWINVEFKSALFNNQARQLTDFSTGPLAGPPTTSSGGMERDRVAFVLDLSISAIYKFTPMIVGRIGYQAMWVDGLALASENFESNTAILTSGPYQVTNDGALVYHGPFVGLTTTW